MKVPVLSYSTLKFLKKSTSNKKQNLSLEIDFGFFLSIYTEPLEFFTEGFEFRKKYLLRKICSLIFFSWSSNQISE